MGASLVRGTFVSSSGKYSIDRWVDYTLPDGLSDPVKSRVRLSNRLCITDTLTGCLMVPMLVVFGMETQHILLAILCYLATLTSPLAARLGKVNLARVLPAISGSCSIALFSVLLGKEAHCELLLVNTISARFLAFQTGERYRRLAIGIPLVTLFIVLGVFYFADPQMGILSPELRYPWYMVIAANVLLQLRNRGHFLLAETNQTISKLEEARDAAVHADQAKSHFLAVMSHELRTPAAAVIGLNGLVAQEPLTPSQRKRLSESDASARHLLGLVEDLLDYSRLEGQTLTLLPQPANLFDLARQAIDFVEAPANDKGLLTKLDVEMSYPWRKVDARRVRQVLINLLTNAVKFSDAGTISLRCREEGDEVVFRIIDEGQGISAEDHQRIFEYFVQGDVGFSRRHGGVGLGLTIARRLAQAMEGSLTLESRLGTGSTFEFRFPSEQATPQLHHDISSTRKLNILVVDDNIINQRVTQAYLTQLGHEVTTADNGLEAINILQYNKFDAVMMDLLLPIMDGLEATRTIRTWSGPKGRIPIIAVTASIHASEMQACLKAGMNAFLEKPLQRDLMVSTLNQVVHSGRAEANPIRIL